MRVTFLTGTELSEMLKKTIADGYSVEKIARLAFDIYQDYGLRLTPQLDDVLLMLMAMDQGPEFELQETELLDLINELRAL